VNITFLLSLDGTTFADVFDADGREIMKAVKAGTAVSFDPSEGIRGAWLKIRSGGRDHPVIQPEDVEFQIAVAT
jgi:hypothetical protein